MASILCIETATDICSVCVAIDGKLVSIRETERTYSHSEHITIFIEECVKEAGITMSALDAIAITSGPGSYTALRIGSSTAKGICYALDIPLISVDTMKAIALGVKEVVQEKEVVIPMLDARRKEVYQAVYDESYSEIEIVAPLILNESSFLKYSNCRKIHFCGDGVEKSRSILSLENAVFHSSEASSKHLILEAFAKYEANDYENIAYYTPFYFKGPNITVQKKNIL